MLNRRVWLAGILVACLISFWGYEIFRHGTSGPLNADTFLACNRYRLVFKEPVAGTAIPTVSRSVIALGLKSNDPDVVDAANLLSAEIHNYNVNTSDVLPGMLGFASACKKVAKRPE